MQVARQRHPHRRPTTGPLEGSLVGARTKIVRRPLGLTVWMCAGRPGNAIQCFSSAGVQGHFHVLAHMHLPQHGGGARSVTHVRSLVKISEIA